MHGNEGLLGRGTLESSANGKRLDPTADAASSGVSI
jgi:hypothetical protein